MGRVVKGFFPIYPPSTVAVWRRNIFPVVSAHPCFCSALSGRARFPCAPVSRRLTRSTAARSNVYVHALGPAVLYVPRSPAPKCRTSRRRGRLTVSRSVSVTTTLVVVSTYSVNSRFLPNIFGGEGERLVVNLENREDRSTERPSPIFIAGTARSS